VVLMGWSARLREEKVLFAHRAFGSVLLLRQCNTHPGLWSKTERALRMMLLKLSPQIH